MKKNIIDTISKLGILSVLILVSFTLFYFFVLKDISRQYSLKTCLNKARKEFKADTQKLLGALNKGGISSKENDRITKEICDSYEHKCELCLKLYSRK